MFMTAEDTRLKVMQTRFRAAIAVGMLGVAIGLTAVALMLFGSDRVGYVQSEKLLDGFEGMKESHGLFKNKNEAWQANIDTLQADFQRAVQMYNSAYAGMSEQERVQQEENLQKQEEQLMQYTRAVQDRAKEEEEKMMQGILNQINSFITEYGEEHGYDMIFGTTRSGSLLYGHSHLDITHELLDAINAAYKGGRLKAPTEEKQ